MVKVQPLSALFHKFDHVFWSILTKPQRAQISQRTDLYIFLCAHCTTNVQG